MTTPDSIAPAPATLPDLRVPVDPEHGLLRLIVMLTFIVSGIGSYLLLNVLLDQVPFINLIAIGLAIAIAMLTTRAVESGMKRRWPSGRYFEIAGDKLRLGNGSRVSAQDTVPFALWCAGEYLDNYEEALWLTVSGFGDMDTTCAIAGGIVALYTGVEGIPEVWRAAREPLPGWPFTE